MTRILQAEYGVHGGEGVDEKDVSADAPAAAIGGAVMVGRDADGSPLFAEDGTEITWRVEGTGGVLNSGTSTVLGGFIENILATSTVAGSQYQVYAKVTKLMFGGQERVVTNQPEQLFATVRVLPGRAATITLTRANSAITGADRIRTLVTATIRDQAGNLVRNGTEIAWSTEGTGQFFNSGLITISGQATVDYGSGWVTRVEQVVASSGGISASINIPTVALTITVSTSAPSLISGSGQSLTVSADVRDSQGNAVPDGTQVSWYSQRGTIVGTGTVSNGTVTATLTASGSARKPGLIHVGLFLGNNVGTTTVIFAPPPSGTIYVELQKQVLAGDKVTDGQVAVPSAAQDGTTVLKPYSAETIGWVKQAPPNTQVQLTLVNNLDENDSPWLTING